MQKSQPQIIKYKVNVQKIETRTLRLHQILEKKVTIQKIIDSATLLSRVFFK